MQSVPVIILEQHHTILTVQHISVRIFVHVTIVFTIHGQSPQRLLLLPLTCHHGNTSLYIMLLPYIPLSAILPPTSSHPTITNIAQYSLLSIYPFLLSIHLFYPSCNVIKMAEFKLKSGLCRTR